MGVSACSVIGSLLTQQIPAVLHASVAEIGPAQCDSCRSFQDLHVGCA